MPQPDHDAHGQPVTPRFNAARLADSALDELLGLARGLVADNHISQAEAQVRMIEITARNNTIAD
ncbi:MAG: hypothetical protein AAGI68_12220 [Planctomycetota bacterium]